MGDIPPDLDQLEPGLLLALILDSAGEVEASGYDQTVLLGAYQRMVSYFQAKVYQTMTSIHELAQQEPDLSVQERFEGAAMEIGCVLHLTRRSAESDLSFALDLCGRVPRVFEALAAGEIDLRRARVLVHGTENLPEETARQVVMRSSARQPGSLLVSFTPASASSPSKLTPKKPSTVTSLPFGVGG